MPYKDPIKQNAAKNEWFLRRRKVVQDYKDKNPCVDCGNFYPFYVMQFDHTGTDKKLNVSLMYGRKPEVLWAEIAKCDLVCANCHAARTYKRSHTVMI